jgi:hypothetical protein
MDPERLVAGYQSIMRTIYKSSEYYQRVLDSLKRIPQESSELHSYGFFSGLLAFTRIVLKLGLLDRERGDFWHYFAETLIKDRRRMAESLRLAAMG